MRTVILPGGRETSAIGFGTGGIAGGSSARESVARLEAAYELGVRHFDTAPTYGLGGAEKVLGAFVRSKPGKMTITTKFGGSRPTARYAQLMGTARTLAKQTIGRIPAVRSRLIAATHSRNSQPASQLSAASFEASLNASLSVLGVEHIDVFLLHEVSRDRISDETFELLDRAVVDGRIGTWGIGGEPEIVAGYASVPLPVVQTAWSTLSEYSFPSTSFNIVFSSISKALPRIDAYLRADNNMVRWSKAIGSDLAEPDVLSGLLLRAAIRESRGIVLFTSRSPNRARGCITQALKASDDAVDRLKAMARDEI